METATATNLIPLYRAIALTLAWEPTMDYRDERDRRLARLVDLLPHGSGIDGERTLSDDSTPNRLIIDFGFHHMDENGYYDGWTTHRAIITPSLANGYNLRITGKDRNQIKEYLHETFAYALDSQVDRYA